MDPDEIFRLKQQLEEEKKKREEVEAALVAEKERADRYKASLTATTLARYLELGQIYVIPNLNVEGDSKGTSTTLTKVDGKLYPPRLEYWNDFEHLCDQICGSLMKVLSDRQLFSPEVSIIEDGNKLKELEVWNEQDVRSYVEAAIESPAQRVINEYLREIGDSNRVRFQSSGNSLSHMDSHGSAGDQAASATEWSSSNSRNGRGVPDRWGMRVSEDGRGGPIFVGEYKAAHRLPPGTIAQVLNSPSEDLFLRVLTRKQWKWVSAEKYEEVMAKVLCQAYDYMIRSGLLYGYVSPGHSLIFLRITESDVGTLFFHYTPVILEGNFEARRSPIVQLATLAMLGLRSEKMTAQWIIDAERKLCKWPSLPPNHVISDEPGRLGRHDSDNDSGEPDDPTDADNVPPSFRPQSGAPNSSSGGGQRRRSPRKRSAPEEELEYCTQACLLGLVRGWPLDPSCPNFMRHCQGEKRTGHLLTQEDLSRLTQEQLARNLDEGCICMDRQGLYGATGVLFKITLTDHGYTFAAKGVQSVHERLLTHESRVYARLAPLQGKRVPVYLGTITLEQPYPLVSLARVTQMMLMSWAGERLEEKKWSDKVLSAEQREALRALDSFGVIHNDIRPSNLLWEPNQRRVMVVDFDQAIIADPPKRRNRTREKRRSDCEELREKKSLRREDPRGREFLR